MIGVLDLGASSIAVGARFSKRSANGVELLTARHSLGLRSGGDHHPLLAEYNTAARQHSQES